MKGSHLQSENALKNTSAAEKFIPDVGLHPLLNSLSFNIQNDSANFAPDSCIDVLTASDVGQDISLKTDQNDSDVIAAIDSLDATPEIPSLLLLCIATHEHKATSFGHRPSISRNLTMRLFRQFGIHGGFSPNLLGRASNLAAFSQVKTDPLQQQDVFDFYCQHPRWNRKDRYDKNIQGATQGSMAPCALYMTHSVAANTTFYIIVAPDDGVWFTFLERIHLGREIAPADLISPGDLVASPYLVHAIISGIALEQASKYAVDVRDKLVAQLDQVDAYTRSQSHGLLSLSLASDLASRTQLQQITLRLHTVSEMLNSGLGSIASSIKLGEKLLTAHSVFCKRTGRDVPRPAEQRTEAALEYIRDSVYYQASWLEQYKARKDTAMSLVFNMVTQLDSATNLATSHRMSLDSSSMHAITIVTMVFLPGTFTATLFSSVAFRATDSGTMEITDWMWPLLSVSLALTISVVCTWRFRGYISRRNAFVESMLRKQEQLGDMDNSRTMRV